MLRPAPEKKTEVVKSYLYQPVQTIAKPQITKSESLPLSEKAQDVVKPKSNSTIENTAPNVDIAGKHQKAEHLPQTSVAPVAPLEATELEPTKTPVNPPEVAVAEKPPATNKNSQKLADIMAATKRYLTQTNNGRVQNKRESWSPTLKKSDRLVQRQLNTLDTTSFAPKGSGVQVLGVSADGSTQVKLHSVCFNVEEDQWRDKIWVPTICPNSADGNRQLLRDSLKKYGLVD